MTSVGQCLISCIPLRAEPKSTAEMVTQVLYGETYTVLESGSDWIKIRLNADQYEGWMSANQFNAPSFQSNFIQNHSLFYSHNGVYIPLGGEVFQPLEAETKQSAHDLADMASLFLNSPYLWGGKTFMGMDCSGLVQVCWRAVTGQTLPRDASQQVAMGEKVDWGNHHRNDLAFFCNDAGKITHVGILFSETEIIHASGKVRIDRFTPDGIYNEDVDKHTHKLSVIKRLTLPV